MTLMTNDLNDHHDRMVVVEVFLFYDKKKQNLTLSRVPGFYIFNNLNQLATILSRVSRVKLTTFISHNGKMRNSFL